MHMQVGIMVQEDLKWDSQVEMMVKKASQKIWMLRRMRNLGVDEPTMAMYWRTEGLCYLEFGSPIWSGGLSLAQQRDLSRVQRRAVAALTGFSSRGEEYAATCARLGLEPDLAARRRRLATTFARRTATASRHQDLFTRQPHQHNTRHGRTWQEPTSRTQRHLMSPLPYLTRLLNGHDG